MKRSKKNRKDNKPQEIKNSSGINVYKRLLKYVIPYRKWFFVSFIGYFIASVTQPLFAEMIKKIIDTLQSGGREGALMLPLMFSGLIITRSIGVFIGSYFVAKVATNIVHDLRCEIFDHYIHLPAKYFDSNNSGYLISRLTNNVQQVTLATTDAIRVIIREGMTAVGLLGYLFYINWQLSLVFLSVAPLIAIVVTIVSKRLRRLSKSLQESVGDLTQIASEVVVGHKIVKSYGGEEYESKRFRKKSSFNRNQQMKLTVTTSLQKPIIQIIVAIALSGLMYFALILMEKSSAGEFVAYLTAAFMLPRAIKFISSANAKIQKGVAAAESLFEVMDESIEKNKGLEVLESCQGEIEFKNVSFAYEGTDRTVLKNICFKIRSGQTIALVGGSGSGKTTLVNILMRFYRYEKGKIFIDGCDINSIEIKNFREKIAFVDQHITLFDGSIKENIVYGSQNIESKQIEVAARDAYAMEFIQKLDNGLDEQIGEHGVKLSGGQRQRLSLARAIYKSAPILILDEATSALDLKSERFIQGALEKARKNRTSIVIAHRLSTIESADVIFVMDKGEIVERGSHKELIHKAGAYKKIYDLQFQKNN